MLYFHLHLVQYIFLFPLSCFFNRGLFRNVLFSFLVYRDFPVIMLLASSLSLLQSENTLHVISILLKLLRFVLLLRVWAILVYVLGHLKGMCILLFWGGGWRVLQMLIRSFGLILLSSMFTLIFCLFVLSIVERTVFKSPDTCTCLFLLSVLPVFASHVLQL